MCGIAGIRRLDGASVDDAALNRMTDLLAHRGPDGRGIYTNGPTGFGHRRLAIRGLGAEGAQPLSDPSGRVWVTYNGEIYNDREIERELARDFGFQRRTTCDTEILPAAYLAWGEQMFKRLEGMFAIALWDNETQHLVLARDGIGIKPLFFQHDARAIRFASEIKSLLGTAEAASRISRESMLEYLAMGYCAPSRSLIDGIEQVPPGTALTHDGAQWRAHTFWRPARKAEIFAIDDAVDALDATLQTVVSDMLISDVPIGVLQSGGIDSTLVSMSLPERRRTQLFTARFQEKSHDESQLAAMVARKIDAPHVVVDVEAAAAPEAIFRQMVRAYDGQLFDSSGYSLLILMHAIREHATVVLSGDGADEFFAGYPTLKATRAASILSPFVPSQLARAAGAAIWSMNPNAETRLPKTDVLGRFLSALPNGAAAHARWRQLAPDPIWKSVLGPDLKSLLQSCDPFDDYAGAMGNEGGLMDRALLADQKYHLPSDMLRKVDAMSMAASVEVRVPFLDRRIMELAGKIDANLLTTAGAGKRVPRLLARKKGAPDALWTAPKQGFNTPVARMLRGPLAALGNQVLDREIDRLAPLLEPGAVRILWRDHLAKKANHGYLLWAILVFAVWIMDEERENHGVAF